MTRPSRRGSGLIEFALGFSVLAVLFVGMVQLSISMLVLNQLSSAVRSGARYAAMAEFDEPSYRFVRKVQNVVAYGMAEPAAGAGSVAPGLKPENVSVTWTRDAAGAPNTVTVSLNGYSLPTMNGEQTLENRPRMTVQRAGRWNPGL